MHVNVFNMVSLALRRGAWLVLRNPVHPTETTYRLRGSQVPAGSVSSADHHNTSRPSIDPLGRKEDPSSCIGAPAGCKLMMSWLWVGGARLEIQSPGIPGDWMS